MEMLNHMVILLIFQGIAILFPTAAAPFYIPIRSTQGVQVLHILTSTYFFLLFCFLIIAILKGNFCILAESYATQKNMFDVQSFLLTVHF